MNPPQQLAVLACTGTAELHDPIIMNPPQKVTSRYVRNLLIKGRNNEFEITILEKQYTMVDDLQIGNYYMTHIKQFGASVQKAVGVTPEQAVQRCLAKHGVTFR
jgi:hypothetical protein